MESAKCPRCDGEFFEVKLISRIIIRENGAIQQAGDPHPKEEEFVCTTCSYVISDPDDLNPSTYPVYIVSESFSKRTKDVKAILGSEIAAIIGTRQDVGYYTDKNRTLLMITQKLWDEQKQNDVPLLPVSAANYLVKLHHPPYDNTKQEKTDGTDRR